MPFPDPQLPDESPMQWAESTAEFLTRSTLPVSVEARARIRAWLSLVASESERARLETDLASTDHRRHQAAVWELGLLRALVSLGHHVVPHPQIGEMTTKPDWLVSDQFYLEGTLATDSDEREGQDKLIHGLVDTLEEIHSPNFMFGFKVDQTGRTAPSKRKLRRFIEHELARLNDHGTEDALHQAEEPYKAVWSDKPGSGWAIEIEFIAVNPEFRGIHERNLATFSTGIEKSVASDKRREVEPGVRQVSIEQKVRKALKEKISRYGVPDLPLIVAINVTSWMFGEHDVKNALFGTEQYMFGNNGGRLHRLADGLLRPHQNQRLSGVLVAHKQSVFGHGTAKLWVNPWAAKPLDPSLIPIDRVEFVVDTGHFTEVPGERAWSALLE